MRTAEEVKVRATRLRDSLATVGYSVKRGQCLEIISKLDGYPDWNTHTADINSNLNRAEQFVDEMLEGEAQLSFANSLNALKRSISSISQATRLHNLLGAMHYELTQSQCFDVVSDIEKPTG